MCVMCSTRPRDGGAVACKFSGAVKKLFDKASRDELLTTAESVMNTSNNVFAHRGERFTGMHRDRMVQVRDSLRKEVQRFDEYLTGVSERSKPLADETSAPTSDNFEHAEAPPSDDDAPPSDDDHEFVERDRSDDERTQVGGAHAPRVVRNVRYAESSEIRSYFEFEPTEQGFVDAKPLSTKSFCGPS